MRNSICLVVLSLVVIAQSEVPSYIPLCNKRDSADVLGQCIINSVYALLPRLRTGIPELDIPSIEPFQVKNVALNTGTEAARVVANLTNIVNYNTSTFKILEVIPVLEKNYFRFKLLVPQLYGEGNYEVNSKILLLQLQGKGVFHLNLTDALFDCSLKGNVVKKDGGRHMLFEKMQCDVKYGKGKVTLENLFNGDPFLGKATNDVINDNLDAFYEAIKPNLMEAISNVFTDIANKITMKFDYDELFP